MHPLICHFHHNSVIVENKYQFYCFVLAPAPISNLRVSGHGLEYVSLDWDAPRDVTVLGYNVETIATSDDVTMDPDVQPTSTSFVNVTGLDRNTEYSFRVSTYPPPPPCYSSPSVPLRASELLLYSTPTFDF